ncbi:MAG: glycosyltransferase [Lachnospiraceae bacterium]|nr:glycosyltransferase [Lachnospiraceae bacterium]
MKKKIILHYSVFNRGGAEWSTLRILKLFLKNGWDVTLLLNFKGGTLEEALPEEVKVKHLYSMTMDKYQNKIFRYVYRFFDLIRMLFMGVEFKFDKYDIAAIGLQGLSPFFICKVIRADKRIIFLRTDIAKCVKREEIKDNLLKYKEKLNALICVSKTVKDSVHEVADILDEKAVVVYNVLLADEMRSKAAGQQSPYKDNELVNVVTVCRMSDKAKGLFRMLEVYDRLYKQGVVFNWYLVGNGPDLPKVKEKVEQMGYVDHIYIEGEQSNPFPYYKYADLVAILSYYEGLCGVVNEAKVSGAAVIATEFSGIHEQITHGQNGWIVDNDTEAIVEGMKKLITDDKLRKSLQNTDYPEIILNDQYKYESILKALHIDN